MMPEPITVSRAQLDRDTLALNKLLRGQSIRLRFVRKAWLATTLKSHGFELTHVSAGIWIALRIALLAIALCACGASGAHEPSSTQPSDAGDRSDSGAAGASSTAHPVHSRDAGVHTLQDAGSDAGHVELDAGSDAGSDAGVNHTPVFDPDTNTCSYDGVSCMLYSSAGCDARLCGEPDSCKCVSDDPGLPATQCYCVCNAGGTHGDCGYRTKVACPGLTVSCN